MAAEVEAYGREAILRLFDFHNKSNYAVFAGQGDKWRIKFQCLNQTFQEAREILEQNIAAIDPMNDATYQVRFYPNSYEKEEVTTNTDYCSSFNFKVKQKSDLVNQLQGSNIGPSSWHEKLFWELKEKNIRELETELEAAYERIAELEELVGEEISPASDIIGAIGSAGESYPWMQQHIGTLMDVLKNLTGDLKSHQQHNTWKTQTSHQTTNNTMATETEVQEQFQKAIQKLISYYRLKHGQVKGDAFLAQDLEKLANKTENPGQFETLRNFL